jgi:hypothetical protein
VLFYLFPLEIDALDDELEDDPLLTLDDGLELELDLLLKQKRKLKKKPKLQFDVFQLIRKKKKVFVWFQISHHSKGFIC